LGVLGVFGQIPELVGLVTKPRTMPKWLQNPQKLVKKGSKRGVLGLLGAQKEWFLGETQ